MKVDREQFEKMTYELCLLYRSGDRSAGDALLKMHNGLIFETVRRFLHNPKKYPWRKDLDQEAKLGFLYAVETYDPSRGVRFSTYAGLNARYKLLRFWDDHRDTIRSARRCFTENRTVSPIPPTISVEDDLFKRKMGIDYDGAHSWEETVAGEDEVHDETLSDAELVEASKLVLDWLAGVYKNRSQGDRNWAIIRDLRLGPRERYLEDVGSAYGISRERVRQIEEDFMKSSLAICQNAIGGFDRLSVTEKIAEMSKVVQMRAGT